MTTDGFHENRYTMRFHHHSSVGKNNRYEHPNKEALDNLKESKIYRTDEDGSIMFKIKNDNLKIETYNP